MAPSPAPEDNFASPSKMCIARIHADIKALKRDPLEGIFVDPDENRVNVCHAIVLGPSDTPYEFGFFYFLLEFPDQYPCFPPRVTLKTTGGGRTRFNPNLYGDGKVCLSILGTWSGPSWSPAQNIGSVLLSIRSLMNSNPYFNEPGFENKPVQESRAYNHIIRHETLRIAILDNVELATKSDFLPKQLAAVVQSSFVDFAELYKYVCDEYSFLDGQTYSDPLHPNSGVFKFAAMKARIEQLAKDMEVKDKNVAFQSTADESYAATGGVIKH
jgi:ubiquitin-conjugating enzyme E2 Z